MDVAGWLIFFVRELFCDCDWLLRIWKRVNEGLVKRGEILVDLRILDGTLSWRGLTRGRKTRTLSQADPLLNKIAVFVVLCCVVSERLWIEGLYVLE
jgi:hypothetical protein